MVIKTPSLFQVVFHGVVTLCVLATASILTAGYVETCQNLTRDVRYVLTIYALPVKLSKALQHEIGFVEQGHLTA
jgi:hypothetical protein